MIKKYKYITFWLYDMQNSHLKSCNFAIFVLWVSINLKEQDLRGLPVMGQQIKLNMVWRYFRKITIIINILINSNNIYLLIVILQSRTPSADPVAHMILKAEISKMPCCEKLQNSLATQNFVKQVFLLCYCSEVSKICDIIYNYNTSEGS